MKAEKGYSKEDLLNILVCYYRMIKRDNGQYPGAVIDDLRVSIEYVLEKNGKKVG